MALRGSHSRAYRFVHSIARLSLLLAGPEKEVTIASSRPRYLHFSAPLLFLFLSLACTRHSLVSSHETARSRAHCTHRHTRSRVALTDASTLLVHSAISNFSSRGLFSRKAREHRVQSARRKDDRQIKRRERERER